MKLLFTGPLMDFSGFATASRNFLRMLLQSPFVDVVARPLRYDQLDSGQRFEIPQWMDVPLAKPLVNVDMAIQMTTCNVEAQPIPGVCNGLYTFFETDRLQPSWAAKAQEFDFLIVASRFNAETLMRSGVNRPILVVAPPCDLDEYTKVYEPFKIDNAGKRTVFYNVCQLSTKKGIDTLLRAYFAAFAGTPDEVLLVLKTYVNMQDRSQDERIVKEYVQRVKACCRIPVQKLPPVLPLVYTMSDEDIHGLHVRGDAYVNASRSEGWGIPVFDALSHGKTVISHTRTGLQDYVSAQNSLVYNGMVSFFYDMPHTDPMLYTGIEQCFEPSPVELAYVMQHFHLLKKGAEAGALDEKNQKEWESVLQRRKNASEIAAKMDYRVMSPRVSEQLVAAFNSWKVSGIALFQEETKV